MVKLMRSLSNPSSSCLWACAAVMPGETQEVKEETASEALTAAVSPLRAVSCMLDRASKSLRPGKTGRRVASLRSVLEFLHLLLIFYTGHGITRGKKNKAGFRTSEFTIEVLKLADLDNSEHSVPYAVREWLSSWTQNEAGYLWGFTTEPSEGIADLELLIPHLEALETIAKAKPKRRAAERASLE